MGLDVVRIDGIEVTNEAAVENARGHTARRFGHMLGPRCGFTTSQFADRASFGRSSDFQKGEKDQIAWFTLA
jgi:hypothetical protein